MWNTLSSNSFNQLIQFLWIIQNVLPYFPVFKVMSTVETKYIIVQLKTFMKYGKPLKVYTYKKKKNGSV